MRVLAHRAGCSHCDESRVQSFGAVVAHGKKSTQAKCSTNRFSHILVPLWPLSLLEYSNPGYWSGFLWMTKGIHVLITARRELLLISELPSALCLMMLPGPIGSSGLSEDGSLLSTLPSFLLLGPIYRCALSVTCVL